MLYNLGISNSIYALDLVDVHCAHGQQFIIIRVDALENKPTVNFKYEYPIMYI